MNKHMKSFGVIILLGIAIIVLAAVWMLLRNGEIAANMFPESESVDQVNNTNANNELMVDQDNQQLNQSALPNNLVNGQQVLLPTTITGTVPGNWFFEGSFPVFLRDANGTQIAVALAQTTTDWMTTNMIPFSVTLPVVNYQGPGTIIFTKDNPSGEPQFDASVTVNVVFQ